MESVVIRSVALLIALLQLVKRYILRPAVFVELGVD